MHNTAPGTGPDTPHPTPRDVPRPTAGAAQDGTPEGTALVVEDLCVFRGNRLVLDAVGFSLGTGGALLLRGPNGAGKSTLLRVLAGLRQPDSGTVLWHGHPVGADTAAHAARVAYLGHQDALKPGLSVVENLALFARAGRAGADSAQDSDNPAKDHAPGAQRGQTAWPNMTDALAAMDLLPLADLPARLLSAGQKRRTALARVLLARAPLWLLDEPSLGLDHAAIDLLGAALARHRAGGGLVIATTHVPLPLPDATTLTLPPADLHDEGAYA
ncbi:heme ABC exporter ATP-binding protein CcmA [Acetobacter sp. TBRC 12305]|uniref:Heme ABC exporter ATP-binding protein CcmA n=1 Tax=Acetobacter garciniae TaxID=2817435 RepID=A0A939HHV6_9PROT|nr:heme ABC exporter ATP-binding protein CcmA [Acetobacter garciniae]MBO1324688.1 heme ABC exporter ATP-binding protein CcmA [Acetobacter garciniae]MBX0344378.1 heme ABC exporter ATP-binding protein CcmA [Acetobacter garciniae]